MKSQWMRSVESMAAAASYQASHSTDQSGRDERRGRVVEENDEDQNEWSQSEIDFFHGVITDGQRAMVD